jgi:hypothetical protein
LEIRLSLAWDCEVVNGGCAPAKLAVGRFCAGNGCFVPSVVPAVVGCMAFWFGVLTWLCLMALRKTAQSLSLFQHKQINISSQTRSGLVRNLGLVKQSQGSALKLDATGCGNSEVKIIYEVLNVRNWKVVQKKAGVWSCSLLNMPSKKFCNASFSKPSYM